MKKISLAVLLIVSMRSIVYSTPPTDSSALIKKTTEEALKEREQAVDDTHNDQPIIADDAAIVHDQNSQDAKAKIDAMNAELDRQLDQYEALYMKQHGDRITEKVDNSYVSAGKKALEVAAGYLVFSFGKTVLESTAMNLAVTELQGKARDWWNDFRAEKPIPLKKEDLAYIPKAVSDAIEYIKHAANLKKDSSSKKLKASLRMHGGSGVGKSYMSRYIAGALDAEFFSVSATDLQDKYIGGSARKVHATFDKARKSKKLAVVFIDEIHVCGSSGAGADDDHKHTGDIHNALLTELDGAKGVDNSNIIFIGATNHPEALEEALKQRMPKEITLDKPTYDERLLLLKKEFSKVEHVLTDADFEFFAGFWRTGGWATRAFQPLIAQSIEIAIEQGKVAVDRACVLKALPKVSRTFNENILSKKNVKDLKKFAGAGKAIFDATQLGDDTKPGNRWWSMLMGALGLAAVLSGH